ncbi:MAG: metal-sensitive transcriptional regulator [Elusimicrobia bacterium]|nr:metal-sensitive transcriptional regulator [Elusimicrobiota bacterium]
MINEETIKKTKPRLKRVEGQIRGIIKMIEKKQYCLDIFQQISAVCGALKGVNSVILENHLNTCVKHAMSSGDKKAVQEKIKELMKIYGKF